MPEFLQKEMNRPTLLNGQTINLDVSDLLDGLSTFVWNIRHPAKVLSLTYSSVNSFCSSDMRTLMQAIPNKMADSVALELVSSGSGYYGTDDVDSIIRYYVELSKDVSSLGYIDGGSSVLRGVAWLYNRYSSSSLDSLPDVLKLQTISLCVIWGTMMIRLITSPTQDEKKRVAKCVLSLAVATLQLCHRELPYWKYIRTVYQVFEKGDDMIQSHPTIIKALFPNININTNKDKKWYKHLGDYIDGDDEINVGQALNMTYTFRIGNTFGHHASCGDDAISTLINSISPVPTEKDINGLLNLYKNRY